MNKNTVQRMLQLKGWQVRKRAEGMRPFIEALPSMATRPDECWAMDVCRVWGGLDGWLSLAPVPTAIPESYWAGSCPASARHRLPWRHWSRR